MAQYLKDDLRERIIESAKEEFVDHGYDNASMRVIAKKSGMTAGNLYRYFKNKEDLYSFFVDPLIKQISIYLESNTRIMLKFEKKPSSVVAKYIGSKIYKKEIIPTIEQFCSFFAGFIIEHHQEMLLLITNLKNYKIREESGTIIEWLNDLAQQKLLLERMKKKLDHNEIHFSDMMTDAFIEGIFTAIAEYKEGVDLERLLLDYCLAFLDMVK